MKYDRQKTKWLLFVLVLFALACPSGLGYAASVPGFDSFNIVSERNIFSPNRRPSRPALESSTPEVAPKTDSITLTGVLISDYGSVAFFDSTQPEYGVDIELGGSIAEHQITEIRIDSLKLTKDGEHIELPVGSGLSRQDGGKWELVSAENQETVTSEVQDSVSTESSSTATSAESTSAGSSSSGLLERLRERRRQEIE